MPKGAFKAEYGYQFRLNRFVAPSKYYKQAVGTSQENMQKAKPVYNISWIIGNDDQGLESKILAATSLGFDASSVMKQVSRMSTFTSMLLYPFM